VSKTEKQRVKLQERIDQLELDLRTALQKKASSAREIDVPGKTRRIAELRAELAALK
jgi:hypothetical protein